MKVQVRNRHFFVDNEQYRLFSGEIHYWRLDVNCWRPVLEKLVDAGFKIVGTYIPWRIHSSRRGEYDFKGKTEERLNLPRFLDMCQALGLKVYFRPGPLIVSEMECGGLPNWVTADPNLCVWNWENKVVDGFGVGSQPKGGVPSYLHPQYLQYAREWLTAVDEAVKDYFIDKGGPIVLVQLDNEVSMVCKDGMFSSDYNPVVVGKGGFYHTWLQNKYGNIRNLPYKKKYRSFEEIEAPRRLDTDEEVDLMYYFDWIAFKEWMMAEYIRRLRLIHEENGLKGVVYCTNFNPHRPMGVPNNWKLYEDATQGICGYDFYREPFLSYSGYYKMVVVAKYSDAIMKLPWSAEFMAGFWGSDKDKISRAIPAEHTEFMSLLSLAHGFKGISYYMFADREYWFNAPVSERGHKRYAYYALEKVMKYVHGVRNWPELKRLSQVAVLYYRPYAWICYLEDPMPADESRVHLGNLRLDGIQSGRTYAELEGLIRLLCQAGYDPSIIDPWVYPERIYDYKAVFVPSQSFMDEKTQNLLLDYVKKGGNLIIGPVIPHENLNRKETKILGEQVKEKERLYADKVYLDTEIGKIVAQEILVDGEGEVLLEEKEPNFLTWKKVGKGKIIHLGAFIGQSPAGEEPEGNVSLVKYLLKNVLDIEPWVEVDDRFVDVVLQKNEGEYYLYLININNRPKEVLLRFNNREVSKLIDFWSREEYKIEDGRVSISIDSKSASVFQVL